MKNTSVLGLFVPALLTLLLSCNRDAPAPDASGSTNPADCRIDRIFYDENNGDTYDAYTYGPDGNVAKVDFVTGGTLLYSTTYTYANGLLVRQRTTGFDGIDYTYNGTDLTNARLLSDKGQPIGDMAVTLDASKRISTLTLRNLTGEFMPFEGLVSTFSYDASGNCTQVEAKLPNGFVVQRMAYSNFSPARSYYTTLRGLYFDPNFTTTDYVTFAPVWKFGPQGPNQSTLTRFIDDSNQPLATPNVTTTRLIRTANQSGMTTVRQTDPPANGITIYYRYTGCQ